MATVALFGGSFNPPHVSHVMAALYVLATSSVDRVMVIPTFDHPFGKALVPFGDRMEMCSRAFADLRRVEVSDLEKTLGGESRTIRTVEAVAAAHPEDALRLVIGSDILAETHKWYAWERIVELAPPIVVGRAGYTRDDAPDALIPPAASRDIRAALERGESPTNLVPATVLEYIRERGLYKTR